MTEARYKYLLTWKDGTGNQDCDILENLDELVQTVANLSMEDCCGFKAHRVFLLDE